MIYFILIISLWIISLTMCKEDINNPSINLIARYSSQNLILVCDVKSNEAISSNIYLNCPFMIGQLCYSNCVSSCVSDKNCLPMISSCSIEKIKEDYFQLKWSIDVSYIKMSGDWKCSYRNIISNPISIEKYNHKPNITYSTKETLNEKTTSPKNLINIPLKVNSENREEQNENFNYYHTANSFWEFITRPKSVLILVCVFSFSFIVNIIFVIRCALFKSVINNLLQERNSPNSCLFRCFCIPVNQKLPIVQTLSKSNLPTQLCYRREEIYDDMSSASHTDRHLINNYSQFELEHESLLSRKLYNSDGLHNVNSRPAHLFSGQNAANYVIVTGPVSKNRNQMSLNTLSNESVTNISQSTYITDAIRSPSNEFFTQEYSMGSENKIYSQPIKSRKKSYDDECYNHIRNSVTKSPPVLPERYSFEQEHNSITNLVDEPISIKNVDLIQHYTRALSVEKSDNTNSIYTKS